MNEDDAKAINDHCEKLAADMLLVCARIQWRSEKLAALMRKLAEPLNDDSTRREIRARFAALVSQVTLMREQSDDYLAAGSLMRRYADLMGPALDLAKAEL